MHTLRSAGAADEDFLREVYASTRAAELEYTGWDDTQREQFLRFQFDAQHRWYVGQYTGLTRQVVLVGEVPAGRLYLARWPGELRVVDIALLPAFQRRGVGAALLAEVLAEADSAERRTSIHVDSFNGARRLYERLGFVEVCDSGPYVLMERAARCPQVRT